MLFLARIPRQDHHPDARLPDEVPGLRVVIIPVEVGGDPAIKTLDDLYESLVSVMEGK